MTGRTFSPFESLMHWSIDAVWPPAVFRIVRVVFTAWKGFIYSCHIDEAVPRMAYTEAVRREPKNPRALVSLAADDRLAERQR